MLRKFLLLAATVVVPSLLAAQGIPNSHASDTAKSMVAAHSATHIRGEVVGLDNRAVTPATAAVPATRATPASLSVGGVAAPASPATPATPAVPASPSRKPANPGQSNIHRP